MNKNDGFSTPYSQFLLQLIGIDDKNNTEVPPDQIDLMVKARAVFNEATENFQKVMSIKPKKIRDLVNTTIDLNSGGE